MSPDAALCPPGRDTLNLNDAIPEIGRYKFFSGAYLPSQLTNAPSLDIQPSTAAVMYLETFRYSEGYLLQKLTSTHPHSDTNWYTDIWYRKRVQGVWFGWTMAGSYVN